MEPKTRYKVDQMSEHVGHYSAFYKQFGADMLKVKNELLKDFCENNSFPSDGYKYYKSGMAAMLLFFNRCLEATEVPKKETKED